MVDSLATSVVTEPKKISDVLKWEADQTFCRESVTLQADEGLDIGHVVEDFSGSFGKVTTAANAAGVFLGQRNKGLVAATLDITATANVTTTKTITIGGRVYTFLATPASADDVDVGTDADVSLDNLASAINGGVGAGTAYIAGTPVENADVTAEIRPGNVLRLRAKVPGSAGNTIAVSTNDAGLTLSGATLSGGQSVDPSKGVVLVRQATVDGTQLNYNGMTKATVDTALKALGIVVIG